MKSLFDKKCLVFHDEERYYEFSNDLKTILGNREKVLFKGGSVQANIDNFVPHIDSKTALSLVIIIRVCYQQKSIVTELVG